MKNFLNEKELFKISKDLRKDILDISYKSKAHHIGSEFSCIDVLCSLYYNFINYNPENYKKKSSDTFILSKGHAALALYVILSKNKFFSKKELVNNFLVDGGKLGGHPDRLSMPGIEINSGSLGHCLSVGAGISISAKNSNLNKKVYVLLGDGELNEGMIWEAVLFSAQNNLNNLIAIVDLNNMQGLGNTKNIINLHPLDKKFESFGWKTQKVDGHNFNQLNQAFKNAKKEGSKPSVIIANTIKGKGVKSMENKLSSHYETLTKERYDQTLLELKKYSINK